MVNLKKETYLKILFLLSITILVFAYAVQFILGYQPCSLCILERIPYVLSIIILILNYNFKKDELFYCILLMIVFTFSFLISVYHFGIEQEFINESSICVTNNADLITKDDILKSLGKVTVNCKNVAFKIFGLSLTTYNMLISVIMFLISLKIYLINNGIKK
jgi:disulfide bond formation protein DsbB